MKPMTLLKVAGAVGGKIKDRQEHIKISGVATDSRRDDINGALFVAIRGENFDGHDFIREAVLKGAACVMTEMPYDTAHPIIVVRSTRQALKDLAEYYMSLFNPRVVAVTGSVGKTTTKDMISQVLSTKYKTLKTEGNLNNEIGLPLTVFKLDESYQAAVFEIGMSRAGEIGALAKIIKPDVGVITNIGDSHIEHFEGRAGILNAKLEMIDHLSEDGRVILNGDDDLLKNAEIPNRKKIFYGTGPSNDYRADGININGLIGVAATIKYYENEFRINIPTPGAHMVYNALAAAAVGDILGIPADGIKNGLESARPSKMRMDIINAPRGVTVINDVYNASPASVRAGIEVLSGAGARRVCILGDMLELGEMGPGFHYDIGRYASLMQIDLIITAGDLSRETHRGAVENKNGNTEYVYFNNQDELLSEIRGLIREGDTVLVKASRGMGFEKTVAKLMAENNE